MFKFKREIVFLTAILTIFLMGVALSAVPTETWYGIKIFDDGLYVGDANTIVIDEDGIVSSKPFNNITITDPGATGATLTIVTGQTLYCPADATVSGENTGDQDLDGKVDQSSGKSATIHNSIDIYGTDDTSITFPAETCSLAGVTSGKAVMIHNSIDLYGTDATEITFPAVTCSLAGVTSGKAVNFANSIDFAGTDSTTITFPAATSSLLGIDADGLSSCAEDIYME